MTKWVAILRGINVGGHNRLPMADLRDLSMGLWPACDPQTYIASGNLIFETDGRAPELASELGTAIKTQSGLDVLVLVMKADKFRAVVSQCPFDPAEGKGVHGFLCFVPPNPDWDKINSLKADPEGIEIIGNTVWLHTPDGISKSKLAERLTSCLGNVPMSARNLNTLRRLTEMLDAS